MHSNIKNFKVWRNEKEIENYMHHQSHEISKRSSGFEVFLLYNLLNDKINVIASVLSVLDLGCHWYQANDEFQNSIMLSNRQLYKSFD